MSDRYRVDYKEQRIELFHPNLWKQNESSLIHYYYWLIRRIRKPTMDGEEVDTQTRGKTNADDGLEILHYRLT